MTTNYPLPALSIVRDVNFTNVVATSLQLGNYQFPTQDGTLGQVLQTDGAGHVDFETLAAGGNVTSSGSSALDQLPVFTNLTATTIKSSLASVDLAGNISTPGTITAGGAPLVSGSGMSIVNQLAVMNNTNASNIKAAPATVDSFGNFSTPGTITSGGGPLITGGGGSVVRQVPVVNDTSTTALVASGVSIDLLNNITTTGTITAAGGPLVTGGAVGLVDTILLAADTTTSAAKPSSVSVDPSGNIVTAGQLTSGAVTYASADGTAGQVLTTNGAGVTSFTSVAAGNVIGTGVSVVNQVPVANNTSMTAIKTTPVTIDPVTGDISTTGTISSGGGALVSGSGVSVVGNVALTANTSSTAIGPSVVSINGGGNITTAGKLISGAVSYANADGTAGQVLTTNGAGITSFTTVSGSGNVIGAGVSVVRQVPVVNNTSTTAIAPSGVSIDVSNNISTSGQLTSGAVTYASVDGTAGQVLTTNGAGVTSFTTVSGSGNVNGSGVSVVRQVPVVNNTSTTAIVPSGVSIDVSNNISTSGQLTSGAVTYASVDGTAGQVLTTNGAGVTSFTTVSGSGNVIGSGVSVVRQVPVVNDTSTTALVSSGVSIDVSNNISTSGIISCSYLNASTFGGNIITLPTNPFSTSTTMSMAAKSRRILRCGAATNNLVSSTVGYKFYDLLIPAPGLGGDVTILQHNEQNVALVTSNGEVWTVGDNSSLQRGTGVLTNLLKDERTFAQVTIPPCIWIESNMDSGTTVTYLAITATGLVYTWGENGQGSIGDGTTVDKANPTLIALPGGALVDILTTGRPNVACGGSVNCSVAIVSTTGQLIVWGYNNQGQLGVGNTTNQLSPVIVPGITCRTGGAYKSVYIAGRNLLNNMRIIRPDGSTWAAGYNGQGALGDGTTTQRTSFVASLGGDTDVREIGFCTSESHAWISTSGQVHTVGRNDNGQLGDGTTTQRLTRVIPAFADQGSVSLIYMSNAVGSGFSMAVTSAGKLWTCGVATQGRLGNGDESSTEYPIFARCYIPNDRSVISTHSMDSLGNGGTCYALCTDGTCWSWGINNQGQAGQPTIGNISSPQLVNS